MVKNASIVVSADTGRQFPIRIIVNGLGSADLREYFSRSLHFVFLSLSAFGALSIACFLLASCSTLTEAERIERQYEREDRLIVAREKFERVKAICRQDGGAIMISRFSSSRMGKFTAHDYDRAQCVRF